jgi:hypothetical protein
LPYALDVAADDADARSSGRSCSATSKKRLHRRLPILGVVFYLQEIVITQGKAPNERQPEGTKSQPQKEAVGGLSKNQRRPMCFCSRAQPATGLPQQLV